VRLAAARAILQLYRSCTLTEQQRLEVLKLRSAITQPHADGKHHTDAQHHADRTSSVSASDCNTGSFSSHTDVITRPGYGVHKDRTHHADEGLGLDFPL
jgi:hypothetical protein